MSGDELNGGLTPSDERDWVVAKSLLDATRRSIEALDEHARYAIYHGEDAESEELRRRLETARDRHEEIIGDLETALDALEGADGDGAAAAGGDADGDADGGGAGGADVDAEPGGESQ